jgi:hypothetical protein
MAPCTCLYASTYPMLKASNLQWVQQAVARYYGETAPEYETRHRKAKQKTSATMLLRRDFWLGQEQGFDSSTPHARHLRPLCEFVSSDPTKVESMPRNIVLYMPYVHWELDHQRERFSTFTDEISAKHQEELDNQERADYKKRREARAGLYDNGLPPPRQTKESDRNTPDGRRDTNITTASRHKPPKDPMEALMRAIRRQNTGRFAHITPKYPRRDSYGWLKTSNKLGQLLYDAFRLYEAINNYRDRKLIEKYLLEDPPLHPRRTLDQAYYWTLRNTKARDRDQVVYRGTSAKPEAVHHYKPDEPAHKKWDCYKEQPDPTEQDKLSLAQRFSATSRAGSNANHGIQPARVVNPPILPTANDNPPNEAQNQGTSQRHHECLTCQDAIRKVPRLLMVDQLWMWILDDSTIITAFPKRYGVNRQDSSGVHKAIRQRLDQARANQIRSVYDLALIIVDECSSLFFDRTKTDERQPQAIEIFSEAIGNMAQKQIISSNHLRHWAEELASASNRKTSQIDLSALHIALLNITPEGRLQRETKDIIEELDIMIHIAKKQKEILRRFKKHAEALLDPDGRYRAEYTRTQSPKTSPQLTSSNTFPSLVSQASDWNKSPDDERLEKLTWFQANAEEVVLEVDDHLEELQGQHRSAEEVDKSLDSLLSLKQQQASVVQAWQSIRHGEEAVKQGRAIMIFTIITIIFVPLAFITALLDLYGNFTDNSSMSFRQCLRLIFGVSVGVICVVVVVAFSNFLSSSIWSAIHFGLNWVNVHIGIYGIWLGVADLFDSDEMVRQSEKRVNKMKETVRKERRKALADNYQEKKKLMEDKEKRSNAPEPARGGTQTATNGSDVQAARSASVKHDSIPMQRLPPMSANGLRVQHADQIANAPANGRAPNPSLRRAATGPANGSAIGQASPGNGGAV